MRRAFLAAPIVLVVPIVALTLLGLTGALNGTTADGIPDAGALTRYGLPVTQGIRDVAAALTVGALVLSICCIPPQSSRPRNAVTGSRRRVVDVAAGAAGLWMWCSVALIGFAYSDAAGVPVQAAGFASQALFFAQNFQLGQYLAATTVFAAAVSVGCLFARRIGFVAVLTLVALAALWPMALTGHAAGTLNHDNAVDLQALHLVGLAVWAGGLGALAIAGRWLGDDLVPTVRRYSALAAWSLGLVAASGVLGGALRLTTVSALGSNYGALLALKVSALVTLCGLGWWQRSQLIERLAQGHPRAFRRIVVLEVLVLAGAAGAAVALSRTAPPAPRGVEQPLTPAQAMLGGDLPPALGAAEWFTQWKPDTFWLPVAFAAVAWYVTGAARLRRRGDRWPVMRTVSWVVGWSMFVWAVSGSPGAYGRVLFSMHMVQHMTIATAVPTFLVLAAPLTLALRTLRKRADGSLGPREWIQALVHSRLVALLGHPVVAAAMFVVSLVVFYYSSLFELSLRTHTGHLLMTVHFLFAGYLFASVLVGVDPGPRRPPYPLRALLLMVTFGLHAFFSVSLMATTGILAEGWFAALERPWGRTLADDQYLGASLGWALGDYPLAILAAALVVSWVQSDRRERRRLDRQADRDGDAERHRYNDYLARLGAEGAPRRPVDAIDPRPAPGPDRQA